MYGPEEVAGNASGGEIDRRVAAPRIPIDEQRTDAEFGHFFEQSFDLHCVADVNGYFTRVNPAWVSVLGWTLEELLARPFVDFVHPEDREATLSETARLSKGAVTVAFENRYLCRDGSYRWLEWNARAVAGCPEIYATARCTTDRRLLEKELLDIADREKDRLGREMHDGLCQVLAGISALSATLSRKLARRSAPSTEEDDRIAAADLASEITGLLNEAIGQTRDMARDLGAVGLSESGLEPALRTLALNVERLFHVRCRFTCPRRFPRLDHHVERHLFRLAQQAVGNAVTHAKGDRIDIRLDFQNREGRLSITDNGVGISPESTVSPGFGLRTMTYRASLIGGRVQLRRRKGTIVRCTFPMYGVSTGR